jgi:hypothetical protein
MSDGFGRYDPGKAKILAWAGIGVVLASLGDEWHVLAYFVASMVIVSTYIFARNGCSVPRTPAWTVPTAAALLASTSTSGWTASLISLLAITAHSAFYLFPRLRIVWHGRGA